MSVLPRRVLLAIAAAILVVFAAVLLPGRLSAYTANIVGDIGSIAFSAFAMGCAVSAAVRSRGWLRAAWSSLAVGLAGWLAGDVIWAYFDVIRHHRLSTPSIADAGYLALPLLACVSALFAIPGSRRGRLRLLLDGIVVAASLFVVTWSLGLRAVYEASGVGAVEFAVTVAYPIADLAMVTMVGTLLYRAPRGRRLTPGLLTLGFLAIALTDSALVYANLQPPYDDAALTLGWSIGMLLVGAAALFGVPGTMAPTSPPTTPSRASLWLPYVPLPFAVALAAVELWPLGRTGPVLVAGTVVILTALVRQISLLSENRRLLTTVADMALRDPLTDLGNRTLFGDRLAHAMEMRLRKAAPLAVLVLDLDDFKLVNDSLGHPAGDTLLRSVGARIQGRLREGDTVARLGGDEFAVLIEDDPGPAQAVAESVVTAFEEPFVVDGREVFIQPSVGIAVAPPTGDPELTADELFRRADLAMYSAKRAKFRGVRAFTPGMRFDATELHLSSGTTPSGDGIDRMQLLGDLRHAIDDSELTLVYQAKYSLATGAVVGAEALIRWPHPTLGTLVPADFLPLVRQNGLMDAVTELVLSRAIEEAAGWYAAGVEVPVAINLAATSLDDEALPDHLLSLLGEHGMPPSSFSVEITEDLLLASITRTRSVLDRLRQNGIRVAIDDFGSGYAAMTYLRELPIDEIKLDRQFVAPILHDPRSAAIVESVIELAETFGISCVAEGVEDEATASRLREFGCGYAQGHYFSPPVPAQAICLGVWGSRSPGSPVTPATTTRPSSA